MNSPPQSQTFSQRLGHNTWQFLSTMIEGYPVQPNQQTQEDMAQFIYLLAKLYPCDTCRNGFLQYVSTNRPRTCCREHLYQYFFFLRYLIDRERNS